MMRFRLRHLVVVAPLLLGPLSVLGQNGQGGAESREVYRPMDGGTREMLESIFIPPLANAPFSLTLETEWSRPLSGGGSYTVANQRRIMRDSAGRIYQERWILVPKGGADKSRLNAIQIADPSKHTLLTCWAADKTCFERPYGGSSQAAYRPVIGSSGPLPDGQGFKKHEDLGSSSVGGVTTTGYRDSTTINPGVAGNDQPMTTTREFWYAAQLGVNLVSILDSPRVGKQVFTVTEINTGEPDPQFFAVPEGYTLAHGDSRGQ